MVKRFTSIILAIIMAFSLVCTSASASGGVSDTGADFSGDIISDNMLPLEPIETEDPEEDAVSPMAAAQPMTQYMLYSVKGYVRVSNDPDAELQQRTEYLDLSAQRYQRSTTHTTNYYFDSSQPVVLTYWQENYGYTSRIDRFSNLYDVTSSTTYGEILGSDGGAISWYSDDNIFNIDPALSELYLETTAHDRQNPRTEWTRNITIRFIDDRENGPTSLSFVLDSNNPEQYILHGVDSTMEYRLSTQSAWTSCTDETMTFAVPSANTVYQVRYKATETSSESKFSTVTLPKRPSAPSVSVNWVDESFAGLTTSMEYSFADSNYAPVTSEMVSSGIDPFLELVTGTDPLILKIRNPATSTIPASSVVSITLYPRGAEPTGITVDPNTYIASGVSSTMQYLGAGDISWKSISSSTVNLSNYALAGQEATVLFRTKSTSSTSVSKPVSITLPALADTPVLFLDYANEKVTGFQSGLSYQYRIGTGSWTSFTPTNLEYSISSKISTSSEKVLSIRVAGNSTTQQSNPWTVTLPIRPATPSTCAFVYNDPTNVGKAVLTGLTNDLEYQLKGADSWTTGDGSLIVFDLPSSSTTYYVRVKSTDSSFASNTKSLTLSKPGSAPSCSYSTTTELISSLSTAMEMKIGNGVYTPVTGTTFSTTSLLDNISSGSTLTISIRKIATESAPASLDKVFTLYARSTAPSTLVYNAAANSISGCSSSMQYRLESATSWTSISGATLNLQSSASPDQDVKVYVRMKPTSTAAASLAVEFIIPQMLPGPVGTIDFLSESITSLPNGNYEYSTNRSSWTAVTVTNGSWDISSLLSTSSKTLYLRYAATGTTPITNYTAFSIAARPSAPSTVSFVYNDAGYPEKAVLSGATSAMQYKMETDAEWTDITDEKIVLDIPSSATKYYIRTKSTVDSWSSANKTLTLAKRGSAPSCSYSASTELISSLKTTMEISIDGSAYVPVEATTYDMSQYVDTLSGDETIEVRVRTKATASAPASLDKVLTIGARA